MFKSTFLNSLENWLLNNIAQEFNQMAGFTLPAFQKTALLARARGCCFGTFCFLQMKPMHKSSSEWLSNFPKTRTKDDQCKKHKFLVEAFPGITGHEGLVIGVENAQAGQCFDGISVVPPSTGIPLLGCLKFAYSVLLYWALLEHTSPT